MIGLVKAGKGWSLGFPFLGEGSLGHFGHFPFQKWVGFADCVFRIAVQASHLSGRVCDGFF